MNRMNENGKKPAADPNSVLLQQLCQLVNYIHHVYTRTLEYHIQADH
jgi:hypothetical protein